MHRDWTDNRLPIGPLDVFVFERGDGKGYAARFLKNTSKQSGLTYAEAQQEACRMARAVLEKALAALDAYEAGRA